MKEHRQLQYFAAELVKEYRDIFRRKYLKQSIDAPYMRYRELEIVREVIVKLRPKLCLEWGCGYSTLHLPILLDKDVRWISIEHDFDWAAKINARNQNPRVNVYHIIPNRYPWTDAENDGSCQDLSDYVEFPQRFAPYDFILVDGRARNCCIRKSINIIKDEGVVILHDANRIYYHEFLEQFPKSIRFEDYRRYEDNPEGGVWIGSKGRNISDLLDIKFHVENWRLYNKFGKHLRC